ncbi:MAG TPA: hypothetical protein DDZ51_31290 [Planctomycetaceae bacterium]|nr:hypothetical protein [Planctomycetaceae bacterium]
MAVRLSVLLVQSSRMSGLQSGINAELVFQLMGVPGIDLSIVNSLNPAEIAETDLLLLSSLETDLAVLDWRDADDSLAALATLGVVGARSPHQLDPHTPAAMPGARRIYLVDLRSGDPPSSVVNAMKQLLDQRRVVAVPLLIGGLAKPKSLPVTQPESPPPSAAPKTRFPMNQSAVKPVASNHMIQASGSNAVVQSEPSDRDLDALVDDLNASDW